MDYQLILDKVRSIYNEPEAFIPLHAPVFKGNEKKYVAQTIDETFVSSVGEFVNRFERDIAAYTGAGFAIAMVNGTTALQLALLVAGVKPGEEVITQPLTFIATANAISHVNAIPVFVDVERESMGMSPIALKQFLQEFAIPGPNNTTINKKTGRRIAACVPMHTFGFVSKIEAIKAICEEYNIPLVEDAAESLGSYNGQQHTGTFGLLGSLSFNGNKIITSGGGGIILTNDEQLAKKAKHLSTTAKVPHPWNFVHDEVGFNFRMPNLNAALACAQLEQLPALLASKKKIFDEYAAFFDQQEGVHIVKPADGTTANFWLNTIVFDKPEDKESFLTFSNGNKVMTRPIWKLVSSLPMYASCQRDSLEECTYLEDRVVNIPSSPIL